MGACHKAARMGFLHSVKNWTGGVKESTMRCCYLGAAVHGAGVGKMKNKSSVYMEKYNA